MSAIAGVTVSVPNEIISVTKSSGDEEEEEILFIDKSDKNVDSKVVWKAPLPNVNGGFTTVPGDEKCSSDSRIVDPDTSCGYWIFRGPILQKCANKKAFIFLYGLVGCIISATYAYFNGTITTMEKRYKIPSRNTGIISVGNDISTMLLSAIISYYGGKGHRPRWIAFGLFTMVLFCLLTALPHFIYGPGEDALTLTTEYGAQFDKLKTIEIMEHEKRKTLCKPIDANGTSSIVTQDCDREEGNLMPQLFFFLAQFVGGVGGSLYYTLGVCYIDDNVKKSKTPALISLSYCLRMLGPAMGYSLAAVSLKYYISPWLHPTISNTDPRWLGAWWFGWIILGGVLAVFTVMLGMFPKTLPRAAAAKRELEMKKLSTGIVEPTDGQQEQSNLKDMLKTFRRLVRNPTLMFNNLASIFYFFGFIPYWIFTPKYIEIQYHQSASKSSLMTGTVALAFSAIGVLLSGLLISKFKPRARYMAAWNVLVGAMAVVGMIGYMFLGCPGSDKSMAHLNTAGGVNALDNVNNSCFAQCQCDYVKYSPVCGQQDGQTYISACHAGCKKQVDLDGDEQQKGRKRFTECSCIRGGGGGGSSEIIVEQRDKIGFNGTIEFEDNSSSMDHSTTTTQRTSWTTATSSLSSGSAISGPCPVDCRKQFYLFLVVMCFIKFTGATGRATNFLVSVRCVDDKDKSVAMGFAAMIMSLFSFIPSPIFFGYVLDRACIMWGKTCTGKGNCWLYDSESLRFNLNLFASVFVAIGTLFDVVVWYYVKDLKIFDEEVQEKELAEVQKEEELFPEKQ